MFLAAVGAGGFRLPHRRRRQAAERPDSDGGLPLSPLAAPSWSTRKVNV